MRLPPSSTQLGSGGVKGQGHAMLPYLSFCAGLQANDSGSNFLEGRLEPPFSLATMHSCTTALGAGGEGTGDSFRSSVSKNALKKKISRRRLRDASEWKPEAPEISGKGFCDQ